MDNKGKRDMIDSIATTAKAAIATVTTSKASLETEEEAWDLLTRALGLILTAILKIQNDEKNK